MACAAGVASGVMLFMTIAFQVAHGAARPISARAAYHGRPAIVQSLPHVHTARMLRLSNPDSDLWDAWADKSKPEVVSNINAFKPQVQQSLMGASSGEDITSPHKASIIQGPYIPRGPQHQHLLSASFTTRNAHDRAKYAASWTRPMPDW